MYHKKIFLYWMVFSGNEKCHCEAMQIGFTNRLQRGRFRRKPIMARAAPVMPINDAVQSEEADFNFSPEVRSLNLPSQHVNHSRPTNSQGVALPTHLPQTWDFVA